MIRIVSHWMVLCRSGFCPEILGPNPESRRNFHVSA